jgi:hypothetical protein
MLFWKIIICYLLLFVAYFAYVVSQSTPDHLHAASLLIGSLGAFLAATVGAFKELTLSKEKELPALETDND